MTVKRSHTICKGISDDISKHFLTEKTWWGNLINRKSLQAEKVKILLCPQVASVSTSTSIRFHCIALENAAEGSNSKEKIWLEFWLENHLSFGMRFPTPRKCLKTGSLDMSQNQNGISISFSSRNSSQNFSIESPPRELHLVRARASFPYQSGGVPRWSRRWCPWSGDPLSPAGSAGTSRRRRGRPRGARAPTSSPLK